MQIVASPSYRSFRIVAEKERVGQVEALLEAEGFRFEPESFSEWCRRLVNEPKPLGSSLAAIFGYIYIQDRSSMLPPLALAPKEGSAILDMCASPGSKSGFLAQLIGRSGFVLANEPNPARLGTLRENLLSMNLFQVSTCAMPAEKLPLFSGSWPYILLDPPCSGWGTLNRNPKAATIWQGAKIDRLVALQRKLLKKANELLSPGGLLVYSTCTTNPAENEAQTAWAMDELGLITIPISPFAGFVFDENICKNGALLVKGEESAAQGFYISLFRKPESSSMPVFSSQKRFFKEIPLSLLHNKICDPSLLKSGKVALFENRVRFLPGLSDLVPEGVKWQGALIGKMNESGFSLNPRMRCLLNPESPARIDIDEVGVINELLAGREIRTHIKETSVGLWWRELPLIKVNIKKGRIIIAFS